MSDLNISMEHGLGTPDSAKVAEAATQAAELPKVETPATDTPKELPSTALAAIAKEKKRNIMLQRKINQERQQIESERARMKQLSDEVSRARSNPIAALQALGYSYEDATQYVLNNNKFTPEQEIKTVRDEINNLRQQQEQKEKQQLEANHMAAQRQVNEAISGFKVELESFIKEQPEQYELINEDGEEAVELVFDTIQEHWDRSYKKWINSGKRGPSPKVLSKKEAADFVEEYLAEKYEKRAQAKKIVAKLGVKQEVQEKKPDNSIMGTKTLNNAMNSSAPSMLPAATERDRIQRALAALSK